MLGSVVGVGILLLFREAVWRQLTAYLVSFAVGTLLGNAVQVAFIAAGILTMAAIRTIAHG